jgi:hypothetical protein
VDQSLLFRLFISSTFSDFRAERQALQDVVFPQLHQFCAERNARFEAVDLRWGITEASTWDHDTMRICLEEVRRSQELSPRPNFAVLLGDRYGWEPVPARIPVAHWNRLMAAATPQEKALIQAAYSDGPDTNAVPPVYCLKPGPTAHESALREALRHAARNFRGQSRLPYFASATHQEIILGALEPQDAWEHVSVYTRTIEGLPHDASARDFIDWQDGAVVPGAHDRLEALKQNLRQKMPDTVREIQTRWENGILSGEHLAGFCANFFEHQKAIIERELAHVVAHDEAAERASLHQAFAQERAANFTGRTKLRRRIADYLHEAQPTTEIEDSKIAPLILYGEGGGGKSALLAHASLSIEPESGTAPVILARFIGAAPGSENLVKLLTDLSADIASAYGLRTPETPSGIKDAARIWADLLRASTAERPLWIFLDALDQLDATDSAYLLEWLPANLSAHARIVASTRTHHNTGFNANRRFAKSCIVVPAMTKAEGRAMLHAWLRSTREARFDSGAALALGRRITPTQEMHLTSRFAASGNALWLKLAYEEARTWHAWTGIETPLPDLPADVPGLIRDLLNRRLVHAEKHPPEFARKAIAYLAAGRFGLAEDELTAALTKDQSVRNELELSEAKVNSTARWPRNRALPPILWSRLYFDLQPYLSKAHVDGAHLHRFFHREFQQVIEQDLLVGDAGRTIHLNLAAIFAQPAADDLFRKTDASENASHSSALRRIMEQPWQLARAAQHNELVTLLMDFGFCMAKCAANRADDLLADYLSVETTGSGASEFAIWRSFIKLNAHILKRGVSAWPAHKILLQLATEDADDSPITQAAEGWMANGHCTWAWLRRKERPAKRKVNPCIGVEEGHMGEVTGATVMPDGRILSWSDDCTLRIWDPISCACQAVLAGHTDAIQKAMLLPDGRIFSWAYGEDLALRLWDSCTGICSAVLEGHSETIQGALLIPNGQILTWSSDHTLRLWDTYSAKETLHKFCVHSLID